MNEFSIPVCFKCHIYIYCIYKLHLKHIKYIIDDIVDGKSGVALHDYNKIQQF